MKDSKRKTKSTSGLIDAENRPIEMIFNPGINTTSFILLKEGKPTELSQFGLDPRSNFWYVPYSPDNSIIKNKLVLFPSEAKEYGSEKELVQKIQNYIHTYLDVTPFFEKIASYYVLFSWIYDNFNELPYLRAIGDYGTGKSRFLRVIGSICYKPMFCNGATTVSPIFRLIDEFRGTLVLDEADFSISEHWSEIIKILNSGHEKGMPVIRSEVINSKEFEPKAFNVYCPKIIATRQYFKDKALESRFIVEDMGFRKLRNDIPISLPNKFWDEALEIRNQLLMFRLRNYGDKGINESLVDRTLEPRLNQIITPLASIIDDADIQNELRNSVNDYNSQMTSDRGMEFDGQILEAIKDLIDSGVAEPLIGQVREKFLEKFGDEYDKKPTARGIGGKIRQSFKLRTLRTRGGYIIPRSEKIKLDRVFERYGIVNDVNVENVSGVVEKDTSEEIDIEKITF